MEVSPLAYPVKLRGDYLEVLDETKLPFEERYIQVRSLKEAEQVLGAMKTRAFGQVLLFFYACVLFKDYAIDEIANRFKSTRPTFDFLLLGNILKEKQKAGLSRKEAVAGLIDSFEKLRKKRAQRLAKILPDPANILTICNVNGELIYLYEAMKASGKDALFYVSETRPYLQGSRLTFWELRNHNIPAYLICDNQAAILMKAGKINCVVTGADRASKRGGIINKIGTYALAILAEYFHIPFYPLIQYPKDIDIKRIKIEERPQDEVFMFLEGDFSSIDAVYPAFDVVENNFISQAINLDNEDKRA